MAAASRLVQDLLRLADVYCAHEFRSSEALSGMVMGKGGFFARLKRGGDCTTATAERVLDWFAGNWPTGLDYPAGILRPNGGPAPALPQPNDQMLADLAHAPIWKNGRRPDWWQDLDVRAFLTQAHRQMSGPRAAKIGAARFGDRCPKKSAINEYWMRLDLIAGGGASEGQDPKSKKEAA